MERGNPARSLFSRRGFLTVGAAGFGLSLGDVLRFEGRARGDLKDYKPIAAKADSVIHIFLPGGIAHQETFDPKPLRPPGVSRGVQAPIPTKIDGEVFCETLAEHRPASPTS